MDCLNPIYAHWHDQASLFNLTEQYSQVNYFKNKSKLLARFIITSEKIIDIRYHTDDLT